MINGYDFNNLFVLDMANNHQGDVEHGLRIIKEMGAVVRKHDLKAGLKFQFRQLETFIHPDHQNGSKAKHIDRFASTRLRKDQYQTLLDAVREEGMISICTPFDEESVDIIADMGFDILKIASCSAKDWPLIEKASEAGLPVIFSTGGVEIEKVDDLTSFFTHRGVDFAIMHCVSIYPTPAEKCHLNRIKLLKRRYPDHVIGWSTHEDQYDTAPVQAAYALGARMFERHIGVETDAIKLNAYSSTPEQVDNWMAAYCHARTLCGPEEFQPVFREEQDAIDSLRRGVYAKKTIRSGQVITGDHVYFSMPYQEGQLESGLWKEGIQAKSDVKKDEALIEGSLEIPPLSEMHVIKSAIHDVKALLNEAGVPLNSQFAVEFSHHFGISNFHEIGAVLIDCVNRSYCKKIVVQLPGQKHPPHFHKRKEETFQVLHGTVHMNVDGHPHTLYPGQTILIQPGVWHSFWTDTGCVFEEVSTTHHNNDSFYADKRINKMERADRKTVVDHWGRFQLAPGDALPGINE